MSLNWIGFCWVSPETKNSKSPPGILPLVHWVPFIWMYQQLRALLMQQTSPASHPFATKTKSFLPTHSDMRYACFHFNIFLSPVLAVWTKPCADQIPALSASIFLLHLIHESTCRDHDADIHPGWRLSPVADESTHDGSEAYNVIYRAGLTFQIQSGTLITDENLRQEIALIANENLMRHKSAVVCNVCADPQTPSLSELGHIWLERTHAMQSRATKQEIQKM